MDNTSIYPGVVMAVRRVVDDLADDELIAMYTGVSWQEYPERVLGFEKCKSLYTENDGRKMHPDTKLAFLGLAAARLDAMETV